MVLVSSFYHHREEMSLSFWFPFGICSFLAVVVVIGSIALAIGINLRNRSTSKADSFQSETHQSPQTEQTQQSDNHESEETEPTVPEGSTFEIHFFDVGEADSALIECDGHYMLIDGGNPGSSSFLYSYLQKHGIDYLDHPPKHRTIG